MSIKRAAVPIVTALAVMVLAGSAWWYITPSPELVIIVPPDVAARTARIEYDSLTGDGTPLRVTPGDPTFDLAMRTLTTALPRRPGPPPPDPTGILLLLDSAGSTLCVVELFIDALTVNGQAVTPPDDGHLDAILGEIKSDLIYKYPDGSRKAKGIHDRGRKHGEWEFYYPNGEVEWRRSFDHGVKTGVWRHFDTAGDVIETLTFGSGPDVDLDGDTNGPTEDLSGTEHKKARTDGPPRP